MNLPLKSLRAFFRKSNQLINSKLSIATSVSPVGIRNVVKLSLVGAGIGTVIGITYSVYNLNKPLAHIINREITLPLLQDPPNIPISRRIRIPTDQSGLKLTLYQYQTCPFCCKVRAFLDYHGISYNVVEVDPVLRQSIKWSTYKKVPIVLAELNNGYQIFLDSSMIVSALSSYIKEPNRELRDIVKSYPQITFADESGATKYEIMNRYFLMLDKTVNTKEIEEERKWRKWADDVLVHTLSPNVYRTFAESLQSFNWFSEVGEWEKNFPAWERYFIIHVGALAMWIIGKRLKMRHNLKEDVRISLYDECNFFAKAVKEKGTPFIGGQRPNLADLAVYGILNSIEGCAAFQDVLDNSKIKTWYFTMKTAVSQHQGGQLL
ncbi:hypothetical protein RI129_011294 [Pyrocoelia pectoralis]|uniref:Glutaredoxin domain-containing protein n=1 Tax=Pyrocoelia pectoralis TaxID=417401 RepID=A0AAN7V583_9COLE